LQGGDGSEYRQRHRQDGIRRRLPGDRRVVIDKDGDMHRLSAYAAQIDLVTDRRNGHAAAQADGGTRPGKKETASLQ
jgi:hypothetical protein